MKEFVNKLIGRLEEESHIEYDQLDEGCCFGEEHSIYTSQAISIVKELAEEHINSSTNTSTTNADRIRSMTVKEMVEKLRVNTAVEIRVNNYKVICVESDNINMVKEDLLNKEVDNWGINITGSLLTSINKIFIDVKGE